MAAEQESASSATTVLQDFVMKLRETVTSSAPQIAQQQAALKRSQAELGAFEPTLNRLIQARLEGETKAEAGNTCLQQLHEITRSDLAEDVRKDLDSDFKAIQKAIDTAEGAVRKAQDHRAQSLKQLAAKEADRSRCQQECAAASAALKELPNAIKAAAALVAGARAKIEAARATGHTRKVYVLGLLLERDLEVLTRLIKVEEEQKRLHDYQAALASLDQADQEQSDAQKKRDEANAKLKEAQTELQRLRTRREADIQALFTRQAAPKS